mgnify:FL=1
MNIFRQEQNGGCWLAVARPGMEAVLASDWSGTSCSCFLLVWMRRNLSTLGGDWSPSHNGIVETLTKTSLCCAAPVALLQTT